MQVCNFILAAAAMITPVIAQAQPLSGLYIDGGAGVNIMQDEPSTRTSRLGSAGSDLRTRLGPAVSAGFGYGYGNGIRTEVEGSYRYNTFNGGTSTSGSFGGQEQKYGVMVNALYDFVGVVPLVTPYVGAGAGYQWAKESNNYVASTGRLARVSTGTAGAFAYQGILGAALPIAGVTGLSLTADYRFMGMAGDRTYSGSFSSGGTTASASFRRNDDFNHTVLVGFRYAFGAAAKPAPATPAAAVVPASPEARSFLVFFDWDKATLTDRARQILSAAAENTTKVPYTRIEVNGYTDTSGAAQYNQGLSVRRAEVVAAELVKDGVPKTAITIQGFGETHLLVPTGAGVREPQNRRVEIIIK